MDNSGLAGAALYSLSGAGAPGALQPVQSSMLSRVGFSGTDLIVEFAKTGAQYVIPNVQREEFDRLMAADSIGQHYNANFRGRPAQMLQEHERIA